MSDPQTIFFEAFDGLDRLAPGSESSTVRALDAARRIVEPRRILDLGCGAGAQTLVLARHTDADVTAVDAHAPFLRRLEERATAGGVGGRVRAVEAGIGELDGRLPCGVYDLLWAEGSLYTIGFERGLRSLRSLIAPGGVFAFTELSWLTDDPAQGPRDFWATGYPAMRRVDENIAAARAAGYEVVEHFVLPDADWEGYYDPLARRILDLRGKYRDDSGAQSVLDSIDAEMSLYRDHGSDYGYVFHVLKTPGQ